MRVRLVWSVFLVTLATATGARAADPHYYLALGDSLSIGIQPAADGHYVATNQGYADDLFAFYRTRVPSPRLAKLGCSGETSSSMISGLQSPCSYPAGSQLSQAVAFLQTHRVDLITLDIGSDNVLPCFLAPTGWDPACFATAATTVANDLVLILTALHNAAPHTLIVGMNSYDPFLALWITGPTGQALAAASLPIIQGFNQTLAGVFGALHVPVADVAAVFHIDGTQGVTPLNVTLTLIWTWMSAPPPRGPDVHPNAFGYAAIASAFAKAIAAQ
jgi:lysophospholipase L1-like esterase